jgi:hypothetical protein
MEQLKEPAPERFLRDVLRPLARIAIRSGLSASDIVRLVYAESVVAAGELLKERRRPARVTDISAATGLSRRAVVTFAASNGRRLKSQGLRRATLVLAAWHEMPEYLDQRGKPRKLPMHGEGSFTTLALAHGRDATPKAILKDLLNAGAVRQQKTGNLRALRRTLSPVVPGANYFRREARKTAELLQGIDAHVASIQGSSAGHL